MILRSKKTDKIKLLPCTLVCTLGTVKEDIFTHSTSYNNHEIQQELQDGSVVLQVVALFFSILCRLIIRYYKDKSNMTYGEHNELEMAMNDRISSKSKTRQIYIPSTKWQQPEKYDGLNFYYF